jgi:CheY-like chemotaxis protein
MAQILVIDDDDNFRTILCSTLEDAGHVVIEARNGREGVASYRSQPMDLVMTDLIMPEQEGVETIRTLRNEFSDVRIIAMSGGGRTDASEFLNYADKFGAVGRLLKPFSRDHLLATVDKVLANS